MPEPSATHAAAAEPIVIIGAGPAGLTAAYELGRYRRRARVYDRATQVGGLARTVTYKGFRFDIGGHRFFTRVAAVEALWRSLLGADLLQRPRLSRIRFRGRYLDYPLSAASAFRSLGVVESALVGASYLWAQLRPVRPEVSFADWVSNRFGRRLFTLFFESYTEKVWGLPCDRIGAQWAAQRIKNLSLGTAVRSMLRRPVRGEAALSTSLITTFHYPRLGPGMMWEACRDRAVAAGATVILDTRLVGVELADGAVRRVVLDQRGRRTTHDVGHLISTVPIRELVGVIEPAPPPAVQAAAGRLAYRDFITVGLIVDRPEVFPDNWLYIQDPGYRVGRIQNYKNWSPEMVPDPSQTGLGMEYFCSEGDDLWRADDETLIALATDELDRLGLAHPSTVRDGVVIRVPKAYPVYDHTYPDALATIRGYVDAIPNLQMVGRNGMHRYNNQDHSMLTAMLAVQNILGEHHDLWAVNADDQYHELREPEGGDTAETASGALARTQPLAPVRLPDR